MTTRAEATVVRTLILRTIRDAEEPLTCRALSDLLRGKDGWRAHGGYDRVNSHMVILERAGLVERLAPALTGSYGKRYELTEAGRAAVA